ncbi:hypothetical protein L218DRAFT_1005657 [Marasmius fiardii PR-910]|nr:hypothetical protein L218DRAFT_1005657 [Marasmius fiardii PR-910]
MNGSNSDDGVPYAINTSLGTNVGEGQPLNSSIKLSHPSNSNSNFPNFYLGFNPALFNQAGYSNMMFPGWPSSHHMFPYTGSTGATSRMDVDSSTDAGDWVAIPEHRILQHIHHDNRVCHDLLGHIITGKHNNDPGLLAALRQLDKEVSRPHKESAQRAKAKMTSVESKISSITTDYENRLATMDSSFNRKYHELQEKYNNALDEKSRLIVEITELKESIISNRCDSPGSVCSRMAPYPGRDSSRTVSPQQRNSEASRFSPPRSKRHDGRNAINSPSLSRIEWGQFNLPFPNRETAFSTIEHCQYCPGWDKTLITIEWNKIDGLGSTSTYVDRYLADNSIPNPTMFLQGSSHGIQMIPTTPEALSNLTSQAAVDGNFEALYKLRFALCFAQFLEQTADYAPHLSPYYGLEKDILSKSCEANPAWAKCSKFLDQSEYRVNTIPAEWNDSIEIPAVSNPGNVANRHNYMQWAEWMFIHGELTVILGIVFSDSRFYDAECIRAYRILSFLTPTHTANERENYDTFHFTVISFLAKAGLYEELLQKYNLVVAPSIHLTKATGPLPYDYKYMAKPFADCGLSVATINSMLHFAWQFCIDMQTLTTNPTQVKARYAAALNKARFQAMFYPIAAPGPNAIQHVPEHWNMANVTEYRRRRAQRTLLKDMKIIKNQKPNQTFIYPPGAENIGFEELTVDSQEVDDPSSNPDNAGSAPLPSEDTVMSNSDGSSSSNP